jgi:hypothetical protein
MMSEPSPSLSCFTAFARESVTRYPSAVMRPASHTPRKALEMTEASGLAVL